MRKKGKAEKKSMEKRRSAEKGGCSIKEEKQVRMSGDVNKR